MINMQSRANGVPLIGRQAGFQRGYSPLPIRYSTLHKRRYREAKIACHVSPITFRVAGAVGGLVRNANIAHMAALSPILHHPASLLSPHASQAAIVTMATLFTAAIWFGGVLYLGATSVWESIEPWVWMPSNNPTLPLIQLYGVNVTGSRFFSRPTVIRAAHFAAEAHKGQVRKTREPYVTHCIETGLIVEGLLAPTEDDDRAESAVIAAILHDVIDDTAVDISEVEDLFGEQVASMVSKVSQLSQTNQLVRRRLRLEDAQPTKEEAAQLRAMILTMVSEPLVIVIKLADRLHNMRTVYALAPEKQQAVAQETRRVWCSLAERLGMFALKSELEDLCFAVLQPIEYTTLRTELDTLWGIKTIPTQAVIPSDCCLTGECGCGCEGEDGCFDSAALEDHYDSPTEEAGSERTGVFTNIAETFPWLGAATALLPIANDSGDKNQNSDKIMTREQELAKLLSPQQREVKHLLESVLPFDASTFNMERLTIPPSARRGLEVLQGCAKALLGEITIEGVASGLDVSVQGRVKSLYSIFKKMARKRVPISQVYDSRALRVVVDDQGGRLERESIAACYKLLPVVHRMWRKVSGEDDDYISQPKQSGYQSLHTAVIGPGGIPMEVQIRTSTMHEVAEYGTAAHWAYKERPSMTGGVGMATVGPEAIGTGHPVLQISAGGQLRDAVVVRSEHNGLRLLVAVSLTDRKFESSGGAMKASPQEYTELLSYVEKKGFFSPGQGDFLCFLEMYTLCGDGKYHRIDQFGHKLAATVVPLHRMDTAPAATTSSPASSNQDIDVNAPEHAVTTVADTETAFMENRIRLLRSMLDWGQDMSSDSTPTSTTMDPAPNKAATGNITALSVDSSRMTFSSDSDGEMPTDLPVQGQEIMVLVWPSGKILQVPRGTTAGSVLQRERVVDEAGSSLRYVNVNNRLVPEATPLSDGDYVVTHGLEKVKI